MKIDYFINEMNKPKKVKPVLQSLRDIDSYNLPKEKVELIKSVRDYIEDETFINGLDIYNDYKQPSFEFSHFQVYDLDGVRALAPILITWEGGSSYAGVILDKDKFLEKYNSLDLVGSQDYTRITLVQQFYDYETEHHIYYTYDGNVFISHSTEFYINSTNINELGEKLARSLKHHNEYETLLARRREKILTKNCIIIRQI